MIWILNLLASSLSVKSFTWLPIIAIILFFPLFEGLWELPFAAAACPIGASNRPDLQAFSGARTPTSKVFSSWTGVTVNFAIAVVVVVVRGDGLLRILRLFVAVVKPWGLSPPSRDCDEVPRAGCLRPHSCGRCCWTWFTLKGSVVFPCFSSIFCRQIHLWLCALQRWPVAVTRCSFGHVWQVEQDGWQH